MTAHGIEVTTSGHQRRPSKAPARAKRSVPTNDTTTLRSSAVGRMASAAKPAIAMTARYPEPPPWPTVAYSSATRAKAPASRTTSVDMTALLPDLELPGQVPAVQVPVPDHRQVARDEPVRADVGGPGKALGEDALAG